MDYVQNKSYGYPVQRPAKSAFEKENSDYVNTRFSVDISQMGDPSNGSNLIIEVEVFSLDIAIKNALGKGQAELSLVTSCRETYFTSCHPINHNEAKSFIAPSEIIINTDNLYGRVVCRTFVVAKKRFKLKSEYINPEFGYDEFEVEPGMLLAESEPVICFVQREPQGNPASIIKLKEVKTLKNAEYDISLDDNYIEVNVSPELNKGLTPLKNHDDGRTLAINILYVPVITYALTKLAENPTDYSDYKWAQVLENTLDIIDGSEEGTNIRREPHNKAQALFRNRLLAQLIRKDT